MEVFHWMMMARWSIAWKERANGDTASIQFEGQGVVSECSVACFW